MKVILSIDSVQFPLTGIGRYTYELAKQLQLAEEISTLKFISGNKFLNELPIVSDQIGNQHKIKQLVQRSSIASEVYRLLSRQLKSSRLKNHEDYIFHGPNFFLPPFEGKKIATFHDLSPFKWSECNTPERIKYLQKELKYTLSHADALITDSEFTRKELADYFSWPIEKIYAVPLACDDNFHPRSQQDLSITLKKYQLNFNQYTLFVGTIEPRKNIITLLEAYSQLPMNLRVQYPLILTGYKGWLSENIHRRIKQAEDEGWAKYLGYLPANELPLLFAGARLFAFPSLYEGFGLPVLEAMASGVPVVCSNSSSLPEVVGNVALISDALDVDRFTDHLQKGLEDERWRAKVIDLGLKRVSNFSWAKCAKNTIDVYSSIISDTK